MLFKDESCISNNTVDKYFNSGIHQMMGSDWFGIMSLSKSGHVRIDACKDISGIGDEFALGFVSTFWRDLQVQDFDYKTFMHNGMNYVVFPIRENENGYLIFFLYCRKEGEFNEKDLKWYVLYANTAYDRLLLNNELVQERNYMERVFESIESLITVFDTEYNVLTYNEIASDILNPNSQLFKFDFISERDKTILADLINQVVKSNTKRLLTNLVIEKDGDKHILDVILAPLCNSKGIVCGAVMVGQDVTEREMMEYEFRQLKHFGLIGEISLGLSHDIKNPLMNIQSCVSLMKNGEQLNDTGRELLVTVVDEVKRIDDIVNQMLSFGKVSTENACNVVNINEIIENCIKIMKRQKACRRINITFSPYENIPLIKVKNSDVSRALLNILENAIEAVEEDGHINIVCDRNKNNNSIRIAIADDGCGINDDDKKQIFTPYYSRKKNGTGLGLFTVKHILEQYNGTINVESQNGKGTTSTIELPLRLSL